MLKPGIYTGLSNEQYHALPFANFSGLKLAATECPGLAAAAVKRNQLIWTGEMQPDEPSSALLIGSAVSDYVLHGNDEYEKRYTVMPELGQSKADKEEKAKLTEQAKQQGKRILSKAEAKTVIGCRYAIKQHWSAGLVQLHPTNELTFIWQENVNGHAITCKARPDAIKAQTIIDLKTTADVSPKEFTWSIKRYFYHAQAAFYARALSYHGIPVSRAAWVAVQKTEPNLVAVFQAGLESQPIIKGQALLEEWLSVWASCKASGNWPYYADPIDIESTW